MRIISGIARGEGNADDPADQSGEKYCAFVQNNLQITVPLPVEVIPHHVLRRATPEEVARIKEALSSAWSHNSHINTTPYECEFVPDGKTGFHIQRGDPSTWRYWVVGVTETQAGDSDLGLIEIEKASRLTATELIFQLGFYQEWGSSFRSWGDAMGFKGLDARDPERFGEEELRTIREIVEQSRQISTSYPRIERAITAYHSLSSIPRWQPLYILGVFAVLESLLTHNPHGDYDSLGHQIKTKIGLLNRRFKEPLDTSPFGKAGADKVWSKLYDARSCVAHGSEPDYSRSCLGDRGKATMFLEQAAKKLLRHALIEPELILDLQKC